MKRQRHANRGLDVVRGFTVTTAASSETRRPTSSRRVVRSPNFHLPTSNSRPPSGPLLTADRRLLTAAVRAFTLVELLVVISIIGALTALLLPALTKAKEQGRRAMCLSNQRQIYVAANVYVGDFNGWVPPGDFCNCGTTRAGTYGTGSPYNPTVWYTKYLGIPSAGSYFINPKGVVWCPSSSLIGNFGGSSPYQAPGAGWRWTSCLGYALPGCAYTAGQDSTPTRSSKLWAWNPQFGPRIFSMDEAVVESLPNGWPGPFDFNVWTPHWNKNANAP